MKICIVSKNEEACKLCQEESTKLGFIYDEQAPDVVLTYGGDGTLLHAERVFPGIPKLPLRASPTCQKCHDHELHHALILLKQGKTKEQTLPKLELTIDDTSYLALNDVIIRNANIEHALRFDVEVGNKKFERLIGDGIVVATPFGSTAYYRSITRRTIDQGIALAFNNTMQELTPLEVNKDQEITLTVLRGPADVAVDNLRVAKLDAQKEVTIRVSEQKATFLILIDEK
jgi:NAD+ kinase